MRAVAEIRGIRVGGGSRTALRERPNRRRAHAAHHLQGLPTRTPHRARLDRPVAQRHGPPREPNLVPARRSRGEGKYLRGDPRRPAVHDRRVQMCRPGRSTAARRKAALLPLRPRAAGVRVPRARLLLTRLHLAFRPRSQPGPGMPPLAAASQPGFPDRTDPPGNSASRLSFSSAPRRGGTARRPGSRR